MGDLQQNIGLGIMFNARDLASGPIGLLRRNFTGLLQAVRRGSPMIIAGFGAIAAAVTSFAVGMRGLRGAWDLAIDAGAFQQGMVAVGAISRATASEMQLLRTAAIDAGIATQFSPDQAVEGLTSLAAAGQNARAATETLIPVLDLAAGSLGQLGVAQAAEAVVGTLNSYRMSADQAASVTDRLLRITQLTNFQARDFEQGLSRAAATGAQLGTSLDDVLVTVGLMRNANINASVASTAFREATTRLMTHQGALQRLQRLGVRAYDENTHAARSSLDIMMDVADVLRDQTDQERNANIERIFGRRGMIAFNAVMQASREVTDGVTRSTLQGRDAIRSYRAEVANANGVAAEFRDEYLRTFPGQMDLIRGTVQTLGIVFGDVFGRVFRPLVLAVTEALNALIRVWNLIPLQAQLIIASGFLIAMALGVLAGGAGIAVGVVGLLITVLGELLIVVLGVMAGIVVATLPVIAVFGAFVGAVYLVQRAVRDNLGGLGDYFREWRRRVSLTWRAVVAMFREGHLSGELREEFNRAENRGIREFVGRVVDFGMRLQRWWEGFTMGLRKGWAQTAPMWRQFRQALIALGNELQRIFNPEVGIIADANRQKMYQFAHGGAQSGMELATALGQVAGALAEMIQWTNTALATLGPVLPVLRDIYDAYVSYGNAVRGVYNWYVRLNAATRETLARLAEIMRNPVLAAFYRGGRGAAVIEAGKQRGMAAPTAATARRITAAAAAAPTLGVAAPELPEERVRRVTAPTELARVRAAAAPGVDVREMLRLTEARQRRGGAIARVETTLRVGEERLAGIITRLREREGRVEGQVVQEAAE